MQLDIRHRSSVICTIQLLSRLIRLEHVLTIQRIRILRPLQGTSARRVDIGASDPVRLLTRIGPVVDLRDQRRRERVHDRRAVLPARELLHHLRVPAGVEVGRRPVPGDGDVVPADLFRFVVERLGDVAEEMDDELHRHLAVRRGEFGVLHARGVVCNGRDAAALGGAVAGEVDGTRARRRVFCIDKAGVLTVSEVGREILTEEDSLVWRTEFPCCCVAVIIGPARD